MAPVVAGRGAINQVLGAAGRVDMAVPGAAEHQHTLARVHVQPHDIHPLGVDVKRSPG